MAFNKYFMLDPAVALEAYQNINHARDMRNPSWDRYYFGVDYDENADTETYDQNDANGINGRRLWSAEWYKLFPAPDNRSTLTWRDRFSSVGGNPNVVQYYSSGEEVLQQASAGDPIDILVPFQGGRNAWNVQEKGKGTSELVALLGGGSSAGWGFNEECETDFYGNEICVPNNFLPHNMAQSFFDKSNDELIQSPFFDPFRNAALMDLTAGSTAVNISFPRNMGYEIPALSFAAGGTASAAFSEIGNAVNMNNEMADGWPAERGGVGGKEWYHSDYKDVSYRYTYKLFDDMVSRGSLK